MPLFDEIVFGPVQSRRLGVSLGVNLLPTVRKYCNYDCIYCECGNASREALDTNVHDNIPARGDVYSALERKLSFLQETGKLPDAITFAGNGEPTLHPEFDKIVEDTVFLRNRYSPQSKITVLSNATMLHRNQVVTALKKIDMPILKLDSAIDATLELINQPAKKISAGQLIEQLQSIGNQCIVQTMFLKGTYCGQTVDNTSPEELDAWERAIVTIRPKLVTIYTIDRATPIDTLYKVSGDTLRDIAHSIENHNIAVTVSG